MIDETFVTAIADLANRADGVIETKIGNPDTEGAGLIYLARPEGMAQENVTDEYLKRLPTPARRKGTVTLLGLADFIAFANRMQEPSSVIFANKGSRGSVAGKSLTAVFNYHDKVAVSNELPAVPAETEHPDQDVPPLTAMVKTYVPPSPRWGDFKGAYAFPASRQFELWAGLNQKPMNQGALADFIETNILDVVDATQARLTIKEELLVTQLGLSLASPSTLLAAARGVEITSNEKVRQVINTNTGEHQIIFERDDQSNSPAATPIMIPTAFMIQIPVFEGDAVYSMLVRLKYRKEGPVLKWHFDIHNIAAFVDDAFNTACVLVQQKTGLQLFLGVAP